MGEKDKDLIGKNLKHLRKSRGMTQQELADRLEIRRSSIGAYEECRATPKYDTLESISDFFEISFDLLLKEDLTQYTAEELRDQQEQHRIDIEGRKLRVLPITVDQDGRENIELVQQTASAGYLNGYADPEYIEDLPKFQLPMLGNGTYRAFEIKGDSMLPLRSGSVVIGEYVQDWRDIKDGQTYVILSDSEGVVYKRVFSQIKRDGTGTLLLKSDNMAYPAYSIEVDQVREIWKAKMYMSADFPDPELSLEKLSAIVLDIQQEMIKLKGHPRA